MDYTIITIQGIPSNLHELQSKLTDSGSTIFKYRDVFPTPVWVDISPDEEVWLVDGLTAGQKMQLEKSIREIPMNTTFRTWALAAMEKCCEVVEDPWVALRHPSFDINHTIFNVKVNDLYNHLANIMNIRQKTIDQIFNPSIALVIKFFLCRQLHSLTGYASKTAWLDSRVSCVIGGTIIDTDFKYDAKVPHVSYAVQTIGGTPWPFFKTLSAHYPDLRFTVSDVDTRRSIIQMKIYSKGKIVTTMTTEETSAVKHMNIHTTDAFGGVYFYLPLTG